MSDTIEITINQETQAIPVDKIIPNTWNPNHMKPIDFETLKESIKRDGFRQYIRLRPHPQKGTEGFFEIMDGEHRWRIVKELGAETIEATVEDKTDAEAMLVTLTMNKLRGEFDTIKLAEVIVLLRQTYTEEELTKMLGYTPTELKNFEELHKFDPNELKEIEAEETKKLKDLTISEKEEPLLNDLTYSVNLSQLYIIETAIEKVGEMSKEKALVSLCSEYLQKVHPDTWEAVQKKIGNLQQIDATNGLLPETPNQE